MEKGIFRGRGAGIDFAKDAPEIYVQKCICVHL